MRISLNQKPNSSRDFGFQAEWDSTGAHVTSIQPGKHIHTHTFSTKHTHLAWLTQTKSNNCLIVNRAFVQTACWRIVKEE